MKRGSSGLSLVVGVDKPIGMTSHDVVNSCRHIFQERRVGHTGTLDPLAGGVLLVCVGSATRLAPYFVAQDKRYRVKIVFGQGTDTDDAQGNIEEVALVPDEIYDPFFAQSFVESLVGTMDQVPPTYSAIKVEGKKAYDEARKGNVLDLKPRKIEIYSAQLLGISDALSCDEAFWEIDFHVSKGTYIRSLARDIGIALDCPAHVGALMRTQVGMIDIEECVSLETLKEIGKLAALDPLRFLGMSYAFIDAGIAHFVENGNAIKRDEIILCERDSMDADREMSVCTNYVHERIEAPDDGELVAIVFRNKIAAIYRFDRLCDCYKSCCVFSTGVSRGCDI